MSKVFISYSRDDIEIAKDLKHDLETNHFDVWLDVEGIETGDRWKDRLVNAIRTCSALVVVATPRSERSHWVMRELSYAIELGKPILTLLCEGDLWPVLAEFQCANTSEELVNGLRRVTQLFIWHAAEDQPFADQLAAELVKLGASLWKGGIDDLRRDLDKINVIMLLVISPESMQSRTIRDLRRAFDAAQKQVIPILVRHSNVSPKVRMKQPYIDFLNQTFAIAFAQLYGRLVDLRVSLKDHSRMPIPAQPPLLLDGIDMFGTAREKVWISGLILDTFAPHYERLIAVVKANPDLTVRFLTLHLDVEFANEAGAWVGINQPAAKTLHSPGFEAWYATQTHKLTPEGRWIAIRLYKNLQDLMILKQAVPDRVEIRTSTQRFGMGYFIVDPYGEQTDSMVIATPYFYQIDTMKGASLVKYNPLPIFISKSSSVSSDLWWFDQYVQEFERLWEDGKPWTST